MIFGRKASKSESKYEPEANRGNQYVIRTPEGRLCGVTGAKGYTMREERTV
jgi:hypothetical protein